MKLRAVTITGADDSVEPHELEALTEQYPFVEWGILLRGLCGRGTRFPSLAWVREAAELELPMSAHLCGPPVRQVLAGNWAFAHNRPLNVDWFNRIQLNFHGKLYRSTPHLFELGQRGRRQQIIFQLDGVNNGLFAGATAAGLNVVPLFDLSGGAGVLPDAWPSPAGRFCGYAGGLSPSNLTVQLGKIQAAVGITDTWIDVETHVRSNQDQQFDLGKVRAFLEHASHWIPEGHQRPLSACAHHCDVAGGE